MRSMTRHPIPRSLDRLRPLRGSLLGLALLAGAALPAGAAIPGSERTALLGLYNATGGAGWANRNGWQGPSGTECDWFGVTCNGSRNAVVGLALSSNRLSGALPAGLTGLAQLQTLELEDNALTGSVPRQLAGLSKLKSLRLGLNQLAGALPRELGTFAVLEVLSLPFNHFSGTLPAELGNLDDLRTLDLARNDLTGSIPAALGNLAFLEVLDLSGNRLSGAIPASLGQLARLETLFLGSNQLSGAIPPSLGSLPVLAQLGLSENELSGPIPAALGLLENVQFLDLRRNRLTGSIPAELGALQALQSLLLSDNRLGGTVPKELGNLSALSILWLSGLRLAGPLPAELGGLATLEDGGGLDLRGNALATDVDAGLLSFLNGKHLVGEFLGTQAADALLDPGTSLSGLADPRTGGRIVWRIEVGAGAPALTVSTAGGTGNADLFLRFGAPPTDAVFDASATAAGNGGSITVAQPQAGVYYVALKATAPYAGVTLLAGGAPGACLPSATALCLNGSRFKVEAAWRTADGPGLAHPVALTGDTGIFWFFSANNVELVVKALNGCGVNGSFWIFAGGLTDLQVDLTVTDTSTGAVRIYRNFRGTAFQPIQDTRAFPACAAVTAPAAVTAASESDTGRAEREAEAEWGRLWETYRETAEAASRETASAKAGSCVADATHLCLTGDRFRVEATWRQKNGATGAGMAIPLTSDTGVFWFFNAANLEVILKVLNACSFGKYWVFAGGLTDVETEIKVTDTMTGAVKTYRNPQGTAFKPIQDTSAFGGAACQ